jgi:hypothetical protein
MSLLHCLGQCFAQPQRPADLAALRERLFSALHANPERVLLPQPHLRQAYLAVACLEAALLLAPPPPLPPPLPPPDDTAAATAAAAAAQALRALDPAPLLAGPARLTLQLQRLACALPPHFSERLADVLLRSTEAELGLPLGALDAPARAEQRPRILSRALHLSLHNGITTVASAPPTT